MSAGAGHGSGSGSGSNGAGGGRGHGPRLVGQYQLGEEIGKGGFGTVFKGLNVKTGDFVAIKRMSLRNVDMDEIESMQSEINLLKQLNHPNIVKYIDTIQSSDFLHIVLEYVEGGSLAHTLKKFGVFSEELTVMYIAQVLDGLAYLHDQGVIHRDIKGANILVTKEGLVKLADFGVAVTTQEKSNTVVGSPYWMAPEIIEMSGTTTACDIWSVGCTVVELLTSKPPYFDLRPMTALFRIVSDDYPPLPSHCSESLHDFLILCFKKEPSFRKTAAELLRESWITSRLKRVRPGMGRQPELLVHGTPGRGSVSDADSGRGDSAGGWGVSEAEVAEFEQSLVNTIKTTQLKFLMSQEAQRQAGATAFATGVAPAGYAPYMLHPTASGASSDLQAMLLNAADDEDDDFGMGLEIDENFSGGGLVGASAGGDNDDDGDEGWGSGDNNQAGGTGDADDDPWLSGGEGDDEIGGVNRGIGGGLGDGLAVLGGGFVSGAGAHLSRFQEEEDDDWGDVDVANALPTPSPSVRATAAGDGTTGNTSGAQGESGGGQHWGSDDSGDEDWTQPSAVLGPVEQAMRLSKFQEEDNDGDDDDWGEEWGDVDVAKVSAQLPSVVALRGGAGAHPSTPTASVSAPGAGTDLQANTTPGPTGAMFATPPTTGGARRAPGSAGVWRGSAHVAPERQLPSTDARVDELRARMHATLQERMEQVDDDEDPFGAMSSDDEADTGGRRAANRQERDVMGLISKLSHEESPDTIVHVCHDLSRLLLDNPGYRRHIIPNHGVLPFVDILEVPNVPSRVLASVLRVVNLITRDDRRLQEAVSLVGALPAILTLARPASSSVVRMHVADFVRQLCTTSTVTLQMLVACGGIQVLVDLMKPTTSPESEDDVWNEEIDGAVLQRLAVSGTGTAARRIGLTGINAVFRLQTVPKNDFCRLFVKAGVLDALAVCLRAANRTIVTAYAASQQQHGSAVGSDAAVATGGAGASGGAPVAVPASQVAVDEAYGDLHLMSDLAITFCHADPVVAVAVAEHALLTGLLRLLRPVVPSLVEQPRYAEVLVKLLRAFKHLSMEPGTLHSLQRAGAIATLVPFLGQTTGGQQHNKNMHNHVMHALFNLCKVNKPRQEAACFVGIVPHLQRLILEQGPLKQLALPLLCDMAHNVGSRRVRDELWHHGTVEFYFSVLKEHYWKIHALNSISMCLQHDAARVQATMLRPANLLAIVTLFQTPQRSLFESLLAPLQSMLERSSALARSLSHSLFVAELVHRLSERKAIVLTSLLKMLLCVFEAAERPWDLLVEHSLVAPISRLAHNRRMVVVRGIAQRLLASFQPVARAQLSSQHASRGHPTSASTASA